ncbi:MAG: PAS domain-containing protein [Candidatus Cloacimonetes bacterium]|nr:PAS domain-containing protein [Candidatus Cloacimonadota bacterium]
MKYDEDIREWINRIYSEVESMKTLLEENNYNITRADIDLSQNAIGSEFPEKECFDLILEPVLDNKKTVIDYLVSAQSSDLRKIGFPAKMIIKKSAGKLAGDSGKEFLQFIKSTVQMGKSRITEFFNAESSRYFQAVVHPVANNRVELLLIDITLEQKHQLQVKRYENLFSKAEETSTTGFFQYNTHTHEIYITEGVLSIFECAPTASPTEKKSLNEYLSCVHDDDKERVLSLISEERLSSSIDFNHRVVVRDKTKHVHVSGSVFYDTLDDTISLIGTVEDITAFKELEVKLHALHKQLDETERIVHIASWKYEYLDDALSGSNETCNILGITPDAFPITFGEFINMIHKDDRENIYLKFQKSLAEHQDMIDNYRIIDKIGRIRNIHFICWNHYTMDGKPLYSRGYLQDTTDLKHLEEQLQESRKDLKVNTDQLQNLQADLEVTLENRLNEIRQQDKYRILNYKWNSITNILQQVAQHWLQPVQLLSSQIQNCVDAFDYGELDSNGFHQKHEEIKKIINELMSNIDTFREHFDRRNHSEHFQTNDVLQEIIHLEGKNAEVSGINLTLEAGKSYELNGKKADFSEAVINIIHNALNIFTQRQIDSPSIKMIVQKHNNSVVLDIIDNGGGISEEIIDRIFEPYFSAKESLGASGLGLFFAKKIIETNFGGQLEGFNQGSGACFRISIPLTIEK